MNVTPKILQLLSLILISLFSFINITVAAGPPLTVDAYWQKVAQTKTVVDDLAEAPNEVQRPHLTQLADEWVQIDRVTLPNGTTLTVNHTALVTLMRRNPPDLPALALRLETLLAARDAWPTTRHTPTDLDALEPILARPEFQWQPEQPSPLAEWWAWLMGKFWEFFFQFMPDQALFGLNNTFVNYTLTVIGSLLLLLALFFALREMLFNLVAEAEGRLEDELGDERLTAESAFKKAQSFSGAGDYRTAVRYLYLSTLLQLDERRLLRYERAQTNREYLRSIAHLPKLATLLRDVIDVFDRVWYGYQPLDEAAYARYAARVAELRQQR